MNTPELNFPAWNSNSFRTHCGLLVDANNIQPQDIKIWDIAASLSKICRFAGHIPVFYSVAEHSVFDYGEVYRMGGNYEERISALLHDATEMFVGDCPTPFKKLIPGFSALEDKLYEAIATQFKIPTTIPDIVREADHKVYELEAKNFHNYSNINRQWRNSLIYCLQPHEAEKLYIATFNREINSLPDVPIKKV